MFRNLLVTCFLFPSFAVLAQPAMRTTADTSVSARNKLATGEYGMAIRPDNRLYILRKNQNAQKLQIDMPQVLGLTDMLGQIDQKPTVLPSFNAFTGYNLTTAIYDGSLWEKVTGVTSTTSPGYGKMLTASSGGFYYQRIVEGGVNVMRHFGAKGDGVTDDTQAFQDALNYAYKSTIRVVNIPKANFVITNTVTVPIGVTLRGMGEKPVYKATGNPDIDNTMIVVKTPQNVSVNVFTVLYNASVQNLTFYWPLQVKTNTTPIGYGYAISTDGQPGHGDGVFIRDIMLTNCYNGIRIDYGGQWNIRNIQGQTLNIGISLDRVFDKSNLNDIHFWPFWAGSGDAIYPHIQNNAIGVLWGRTDLVQGSNFFAFGMKNLFQFTYANHDATSPLESGAAWAQLSNIAFDYCLTGIQIDRAYYLQLSQIQGTSVGNQTGRGLIETGSDVAGDVIISGFQGWHAMHLLKINSNSGSFDLSGLKKQVRGDANDVPGYLVLHQGTAPVRLDKADYSEVSGPVQIGPAVRWSSDTDVTASITNFASPHLWPLGDGIRMSAITGGTRFNLNSVGTVAVARIAAPADTNSVYVVECDMQVVNPANLNTDGQFYLRLSNGSADAGKLFPASATSGYYPVKTHIQVPFLIRKGGLYFDFVFGGNTGANPVYVDLTNLKLYKVAAYKTTHALTDWLQVSQPNPLLTRLPTNLN